MIIHYLQGVALFDEWWDQDEINTEMTVSAEVASARFESALQEETSAQEIE